MSRVLNILLLTITIIVLLTALGGGILLATFNPNKYREQFRAGAEELTGCRVTLHDPLEITFLPQTGLKTGRVTLHDPATASEEPVLEAADIFLSLALRPLMDNQLDVREAVVQGARIRYTAGAGSGAFFLRGQQPAFADPVPETHKLRFVPNLEQLVCNDTEVTVSDDAKNLLWSLRLDKTEMTGVRLNADVPVRITGAVLDGGNGSPFALDAVAHLRESGDFSAKVASLNVKLDGLGDLPLLLESQGGLTYAADAGTFAVENLRGTLRASGALTAAQEDANPASSEFRGHLAMQLPREGKTPSLSGTLHAARLDLDVLLHGLDPAVRFVEQDGEAIKGAPNFTRPKVSRVVSGSGNRSLGYVNRPAPAPAGGAEEKPAAAASWRTLLSADTALDLALSADELVVRRLPLRKVEVNVRSVDKQAAIPFSFDFFGGAITGTGRADFSRKLPSFAIASQARGVHVRQLLTAWGAGYDMSGVGSATLEVSGQGHAYTDFMHSLKGTAAFQVLNGEIRGFTLIPGDLPHHLTAPQNFLFQKLSASANIVAGTATMKEILLESALLSGKGGGSIHLAYKQLDIGMDFQLNNKPPSIPVSISGPYNALAYGVDMQLFMRNMDEAYAEERQREEGYRGTGEIYLDEDGMLRSR